jgi:bifunctional non-homologous end joining protein LigD
MLATATRDLPTGATWWHEVKWDGIRVLLDAGAEGGDGAVRVTSRNGNVVTPAWPDVTPHPLAGRDLLVDGEIIGLDDAGRPDFRVLQPRIHARGAREVAALAQRVPATLMVFDLLRLDGDDLTGQPLEERRGLLEGLGLEGTHWQVPPTYDDGAMLLAATREQGLEGVVSKRRTGRYRPGERSHDWLKLAHRHRGSYVVGGWRPQVGTSDRLAALLVGEMTAEGLAYRGRVGSGIAGATSRRLRELLAPLESAASPFVDEVPRVDADGTRWVAPRVVVDVDTHGTGHARLRQPSFRGVRDDVAPDDLLPGAR